MAVSIKTNNWPVLNYNDYGNTIATVQLWAQVIGKIRLRNSPWVNHAWHVTLYVSARGFTTGAIPYPGGNFDIEFDFVAHQLIVRASPGRLEMINLKGQSVASFYRHVINILKKSDIPAIIYAKPNEVDPAIPFADDTNHNTYNADAMHNLWLAFIKVDNVFKRFRAGFTGKCSPVHLFWGAFDLAVTRFSGRAAPLHPGGAPNMPVRVMQEAYSHEVSSCGFWPGSKDSPQAVFYAYCYPTPADFPEQKVTPAEAVYYGPLGEFVLTYEALQKSAAPEEMLLSFLQSTYDAAAKTGNWDRKNLECDLTGYEY